MPAGSVVRGVSVARTGAGGALEPGIITARAVVIAAGGLGQAFATTSNPAGATGDGIAIAARAGAVLRDLEFVQFHPTVLWQEGGAGQRPLITEALRGAGAVLRDLDGTPVMAGRHPRGDLAPRDVVAAAMHEVMERDGSRHLWLDATALGRHVVEDGFPTVTAACRWQGVDPVTGLIPVAPGAHYSCGGIAAGMDGRTSIPGLYAVGEAASTGVHGANRLASNSLVEAVITGRAAARSIVVDRHGKGAGEEGAGLRGAGEGSAGEEGAGLGGAGFWGAGLWGAGLWGGSGAAGAGAVGAGAAGGAAGRRAVLAAAMSRYAGVVRDRDGLRELLRVAGRAAADSRGAGAEGLAGGGGEHVRGQGVDLDLVESTNLHEVSVLIAAGAMARTESRGCHRRRDFPDTWPEARHTLLRWTPDGLKVEL